MTCQYIVRTCTQKPSKLLASLCVAFPRLSVMPNLPAADLDQKLPPRLRSAGSQKDVFVMVKANMSDSGLSQPPLLVFAESFLPACQHFWSTINSTEQTCRAVLDEERRQEIESLLKALREDFPHLTRTFRYYESLLNNDRPRQPYEQIEFISNGPSAADRVARLELGQRPDPPRPHWLQVMFHRN